MHRRGHNLMKPWKGSNKYQLSLIVSSLVLILVVSVLIICNTGRGLNSLITLPNQKWDSFEGLVELNPTVEYRNGTDLIWQIPALPKGAIFLAHGCSGRAVNFWDKSPNCPNCVGLPEERLIVLHSLARKFAVLTISSAGHCWSYGEERIIIKEIIRWWVGKNNLQKLPLVALGASSGGYFVSALATELKFSSITLMIAEGLFDRMDITKDYPPTLFVHMPKDRSRNEKIDKYIVVLRNKGIEVAEIKCREFALSPNLLSHRISGLDQTVSVKLFELFKDKGFIDKNGFMKKDGRATRWKKAVAGDKIVLADKNLADHIQEELNLAYSYHEMTSLQSTQIFEWFESHMS